MNKPASLPPDLDELLTKLLRLRAASSPEFKWGRFFVWLLFLLGASWIAAGFYKLESGEAVVVQKLGRYVATETREGMHWIPRWIDTFDRVHLTQRIELILPEKKSKLILSYQIIDPKNYIFSAEYPEEIIKILAAFSTQPEAFAKALDPYELGIKVNAIHIEKEQIEERASSGEVTSSKTQADSLIQEAEQANQKNIEKAKADASEMAALFPAYKKSPIAMKALWYREIYESLLQRSNKVIVNTQSSAVLPVSLSSSPSPISAPASSKVAFSRVDLHRPDREVFLKTGER